MAKEENGGDVKHVIILDEKKKNNEPVNEDAAQELLRELNSYAGDDGEDDEERIVTQRTRIRIKRRKKITRLQKHLLILAASVLVLIGVIVAASEGINNNYRAPVNVYELYLNKPSYDGEELSYAYGNGLAERKLKKLRDILHSSDEYMDGLNASANRSAAEYEANLLKYGEDFRYTVRIDAAFALSQAELAGYSSDFSGIIRDIGNSSLTRSDSGELTVAVLDVTSALENARITRGYRLECTKMLSGGTADGPVSETEKCTFTVVKLNGRWIMWDKIYDILRLSY